MYEDQEERKKVSFSDDTSDMTLYVKIPKE